MRYMVSCRVARKINAIGIFYPIEKEYEASSEKEAKDLFYEEHHVYFGRDSLKVTLLHNEGEAP